MGDDMNGEKLDWHLEASEACFVFAPSGTVQSQPATKKRKIVKQRDSKDVARPSGTAELPLLLNGREPAPCAAARLAAFRQAWGEKEIQLEEAINTANAGIVADISDFIVNAIVDSSSRQVPAGLINAGLASSTSGSMFEPVAQTLRGRHRFIVLSINAPECHNLKAALKTIILRGMAKTDNSDDEDEYVKRTELLNYDLQALHQHVQAYSIDRCVIFFRNSEALDPQVLAELVDVLVSWRDRLPFVLLFEMAISGELFQEKLARSTVRQLRGAMFESKPSREILDLLFSTSTCHQHSPLFLGPAVSRMLLDQQTDRIASVKSFISTLKYCYMMHFFQNPLSFLCADKHTTELRKEHVDYLRDLPSFRRHLDMMAGDGRSAEASKLMRDKSFLLDQACSILKQSRQRLQDMQTALEVLLTMNKYTNVRPNLTHSSLYIKALAGDLEGSQILRDLLVSVRKLSSDKMLRFLEDLRDISILSAEDLGSEIVALQSLAKRAKKPLRSIHEMENETIRTTVEGQKVVLAKGDREVDPQVTAYTQIIDKIDLIFVSFMAKTIVAATDVCFHEILVFDGKSLCRDILAATPRASIERALSRPHDYLACECCNFMEGQLAGTQPATALAYQLYLESGATINIQDFWSAYKTVLDQDGDEDGARREETLALAELRYLGMLRNNKRKADHLAKIRWKGL